MRLFWKIAIPVACVAVIGGAAVGWSAYKAKVNRQRLTEAARACRVRAEQGDAQAEYELSHMYYYGQGVPQDYAEALQWGRKAADQGFAKAEYDTGYLYYHGQGVSQDYTRAAGWYRKAADQGNAYAQGELGFMYSNGQGVGQDYAEALLWRRKAADQGDAVAEDGLASMYSHGHGVSQDYTEAARWYRKAADQGYAGAQSGLGFLYYYGYGVQQDRAEANRWLRKAAAQGDEYAQQALSESLTTGRKFFLLIQLVLGMFLATSFLSLNTFEPRTIRRSSRQGIMAGTGVLCIFNAALSWYGYTHYKIRCLTCGLDGFTCVKFLLNGITLALLVYIVLSNNGPGVDEREITGDDSAAGSDPKHV